jgi:hypothetical protein
MTVFQEIGLLLYLLNLLIFIFGIVISRRLGAIRAEAEEIKYSSQSIISAIKSKN